MVDSPPPAAGSHRPGYSSNALDLAHWAMPYSLLTDFFPPLPDHSPHPQDVGVTHRRIDLIYLRSPPPSIKCPALTTLLQGMGRMRTRSRRRRAVAAAAAAAMPPSCWRTFKSRDRQKCTSIFFQATAKTATNSSKISRDRPKCTSTFCVKR